MAQNACNGGRKMKKTPALLLALVLAVLAFAGCGAGKTNSAGNKAYAANETAESATNDSAELGTLKDLAQQRKLIKNYEITTKTQHFTDFVKSVTEQVTAAGGYVESSTQSTEGYNGETTGELVLRVPSQKTGSLTSYIAQNSTVTKQSSQVLDVTDAYIDTESRLSALKAEKQALEALLNKAGSLSDIMAVQKQLTEVISQIEAAEAKLKKYNNEIEFDTVTLTILQARNSTADGSTVWGRITNGFSGSLHALGTFFTELFVILLSGLPFILLVAAVAAAIVLAVRHQNKKRQKANLAKEQNVKNSPPNP